MKRKELKLLNLGLAQCGDLSHPTSHEFAYTIVCAAEAVGKALKAIEKSIPPTSKEYQEFEAERLKILDLYALKNEDGSYVMQDENSAVLRDPAAYTEGVNKLKEKYSAAVKAQEKLDKKFEDFMEAEADDFKFTPIPKKVLPPNITPKQLFGIRWILEMDKKE